MSKQDYTTAFTVDQTPKQAFDVINNVRGWWSEELDGATERVGDEFTYRHKDLHRSTQKLIEVIPNEKVVWLVVDGHLSFVDRKNEWTGTKVIFDIAKKNGKTELRVMHQGLTPDCECFDACSKGWGFYVNGSLRSLITTGKGQPDRKKKARRVGWARSRRNPPRRRRSVGWAKSPAPLRVGKARHRFCPRGKSATRAFAHPTGLATTKLTKEREP